MMRIVILGAGYAGLDVARRLGKLLGTHGVAHVTLVNAHGYHVFNTELHKVAAGTARSQDVSVALSDVLPQDGLQLEIGTVQKINPDEKTVELDNDRILHYDRLVVALGSEAEYWGIPGLAEHSLGLTGLQTAVEINKRVHEVVAQAEEEGRQAHVVIGGGGLTGVELAGELAYKLLRNHRITLVEMGPNLLLGQPEAMSQDAERLLGQLGVTIRTGVGLKEVQHESVCLTNDEEMAYDLLLWAGGVRGNRVVAEAFKVDGRDRAYVDSHLRAEEYPDVYILGDAALAKEAKSGRPVPPTAQAALQQATIVVEHLLRSRFNEAGTVPPYSGKNKGVLVSIGPKLGLGKVGALQGAGRTWKHLKDANDLKYRLKVGAPLFGGRGARWEADNASTKTARDANRPHTA